MIRLTKKQLEHLNILLWLFDCHRNMTSGRSTLMAYVLVQLAIDGHKVNIAEYTTMPLIGRNPHLDKSMLNNIKIIIKENYPKLKFAINETNMTLQLIK